MLCKHGGMEEEISERVMKGRHVVVLLAEFIKRRNVSYGHEEGSKEEYLKT